jgi:hypothetical protein
VNISQLKLRSEKFDNDDDDDDDDDDDSNNVTDRCRKCEKVGETIEQVLIAI